MFEKKEHTYKSPDLTKMQEVIINHRTRIYIVPSTDVKEAKRSFIDKHGKMSKP
jgi:hypothetical protein